MAGGREVGSRLANWELEAFLKRLWSCASSWPQGQRAFDFVADNTECISSRLPGHVNNSLEETKSID